MLDRYLVARGRALDLATGAPIRWHVRRNSSRSAALFTERGVWWLIDWICADTREWKCGRSRRSAAGMATQPCGLDALRAALADARDGRPQGDRSRGGIGAGLGAVGSRARSRGSPHRLCSDRRRGARRGAGAVELALAGLAERIGRSSCSPSGESLSAEATIALFRLATRDARPHVIVRRAVGEHFGPTRLVVAPASVHETAPRTFDEPAEADAAGSADAIDTPEMLPSRAGRLLDAGRVADAEACARWGVLLVARRRRTTRRAVRHWRGASCVSIERSKPAPPLQSSRETRQTASGASWPRASRARAPSRT